MNYPEDFDVKAVVRMTVASFLIGLFFAGVARVGMDINNNNTPQTVTTELLG